MTTRRRLDLFAAAVAATMLALAGYALWRPAPASLVARVVTVAWQCEPGDGGACMPLVEVERCTTCHEAPHASILQHHESIGCVACHGGDGVAASKAPAHVGLAVAIEARCALCHEGERAVASPARAAWKRWLAVRDGKPPLPSEPAQPPVVMSALSLTGGRSAFRSLRCGACHEARDASPIATPLDTLALRSGASELAAALAGHGARTGYELHLDQAGASAVAAHLRGIEAAEPATALLHRASVPGSSPAEGHILATNLRCAACHTDLPGDAKLRTADWLAYYLMDPSRANEAARMPSLHLSPREAASLAQSLASTGAGGAGPTPGRSDKGEALVREGRCDACHARQLAPSGPSLRTWGDAHDEAATTEKLRAHAGYALSPETLGDLVTYLMSHRGLRVREDLRVHGDRGADLYASAGCGGCHALDDPAAALTLFGEGLRMRPQWLFEYLAAPERHPIRPPYHPEQAYRDLVPADRVTVRMPTYRFDDADITSLVGFFAERDGASFPYASARSQGPALAGDALTSAIGDVTRKDRGACLSCHTVAAPDVMRAREEGDKLAPPLALAHERLRPAWIEACLVEPDPWAPRMPALARVGLTSQVERVRDLVLLLRDRTILPPAGSEGVVPALGLGDLP